MRQITFTLSGETTLIGAPVDQEADGEQPGRVHDQQVVEPATGGSEQAPEEEYDTVFLSQKVKDNHQVLPIST